MSTAAIIIALALAQQPAKAAVFGPAPPPPAKPAVDLLPTELDAVGWTLNALLDRRYTERDRFYLRFVWLPPAADAEWHGVMDFAVNAAASQTPVLVRADIHANGFLLAYNLERLAPEPAQLKRLVSVWDELAVRDPVFHVPELNLEKAKKKAAFLAPHLQEALARHATDATKSQRLDVLVTQLTHSTGAIYSAPFLLEQLLGSVHGKYLEFRQIDFKVEKFTPLQAHLKKFGWFFEQSQEGRGDKGAFLVRSGISRKRRIIETVFGLFSRQPLVITFDVSDKKKRAAEHFARNLVKFQQFTDAGEIFRPMSNGLIEYLLVNGKGEFQRVAPSDIVADQRKPDGGTTELECGISCITCHFPDGGYKLARNDLELLIGSDTDFFGEDFSYIKDGKKVVPTHAQKIELLASRYGEPIYEPTDGILGRAERDFHRAVASLTDYPVKADGPNAVQRLGVAIKSIYHAYRYDAITAETMCLELGVRVAPGQGLAVFKQLCPPPPAGQEEDILIALLRAGAEITRDDAEAIYGELARRAIITRPTLAGKGAA